MIKAFMLFAVITSNQGTESLVAIDKGDVMESILALQAYLQASETSIDFVLALLFGLMSLIITGYLIEQHINKDNG